MTLESDVRPVQVRFVPGRTVVVQYATTVSAEGGEPRPETFVASTGQIIPSETAIVSAGGIDVAVWRSSGTRSCLAFAPSAASHPQAASYNSSDSKRPRSRCGEGPIDRADEQWSKSAHRTNAYSPKLCGWQISRRRTRRWLDTPRFPQVWDGRRHQASQCSSHSKVGPSAKPSPVAILSCHRLQLCLISLTQSATPKLETNNGQAS